MKRKRLHPKATDGPSENDFNVSLEQWDDSVFLNADHFRLHRFHPNGYVDRARVTEFPTAMREALIQIGHGFRVLVYAVTKSGRYQAMVPERWEHYAKLYNNRNKKQ